MFSLGEYVVASSYCREDGERGGSLILLKPSLEYKRLIDIENLSVKNDCELSAVFVRTYNVHVLSVYRIPAGQFDTFMGILERALNRVSHGNIIIAGDFNVWFGTDNDEAVSLSDLFDTFNLKRMIFEPTRGNKCLDNIFINFDTKPCIPHVLDLRMSDHSAQTLTFRPPQLVNAPKIRKVCRPITQHGKFLFHNMLDSASWSFVDCGGMDINTKFNAFVNIFRDCFLLAFPEKTYIAKSNFTYHQRWFGDGLREMREKLHFLYDLSKTLPGDEHLKREISILRNRYKTSIKNAKIATNDNLIKNSNTPVKTMWQIINDKRRVGKPIEQCYISPDDFNDYFVSIAESLVDRLGAVDLDPLVPLSSLCLNTSFSFSVVSFNTVRDTVNNLKNTNSRDIYGLNTCLIKTVINVIIVPLTKLVNQCMQAATFPDVLKCALVVPIHKKGDTSNVSNYRPISLLPVISKVVEKIMASQIMKYFESNNLFCPSQYGFRNGRNTAMAILELVEGVLDGFENKLHRFTTFCDLSKAFDCVSHDILLRKLQTYGFDENSTALVRSYLTNRSQVVAVGNKRSECLSNKYGVPQGSILGPLLFLIYINDLPQYNLTAEHILYADDTTISAVHHDIKQLRRVSCDALSNAERWFAANRLTLNNEKTVNILFSLRTADDAELSAPSTKFLGVHLDCTLKWEKHVEVLTSKLKQNVFLLRGLSESVSELVLRTAYFSLCHSVLSYAILAWGRAANWWRVFAIQRRAVRIVAGLGYRQDCRAQFVGLGILTFPSVYIYELMLYAKKNLNKFPTNNNYHAYSTRGGAELQTPYRRLTKSQRGVNFLAPKYYNKLPAELRNMDMTKFRVQLKRLLVSKAYYSYDEFLCDDLSAT